MPFTDRHPAQLMEPSNAWIKTNKLAASYSSSVGSAALSSAAES